MNPPPPSESAAGNPSALPAASATHAPPSGPFPGRGRVLYVDDDDMARNVLGGWLGLNGYEHRSAANPSAGDAVLDQEVFDLVISDIHMPGNHRLEWVERVLNRPNPPAVILVTGSPNFETACRAANLPVAGYLLKPVALATLDPILQRIIHGQRQRADFLGLSHDILRLLETQGAPDVSQQTLLVNKLAQLAHCFNARSLDPSGDGSANDLRWRAALADTIAVIEKTKHSFHSRELGQLRIRLKHLLAAV